MPVYLIHFSQPLHHANHYIGFVENLRGMKRRMREHSESEGAKILKALNEKGIDYNVVRVWEHADRHFERQLKNYKKAWRLCPICSGSQAMSNMTLEKLGIRAEQYPELEPGHYYWLIIDRGNGDFDIACANS